MSNFVYPLVLNRIDTAQFAEEYILIILSDFLAGSMFGNTEDLNRVRDIFHVVYGIGIPPHSPTGYIKKQIDFLASQYYKIDFFQYSFLPLNTLKRIGILSYKIKPKVGVLTPEDVSLFVDGNLHLDQRGYQSREFKISATSIKFTHNISLIPEELKMTISVPVGKKDSLLFNDIIASRNHEGIWESVYSDDARLMNFDSLHSTYFVPDITINLDTLINKKEFEKLNFRYTFKTKYSVTGVQPLNFTYNTERALPIESIDYSTKAIKVIMYIILPILAVLLLIIFLVTYGKPRKLLLRTDGFLDSFEKIDFKTHGKLTTPFKAWNFERQSIEFLLIQGSLAYKSAGSPMNWHSPIYLKLRQETVPDGFELFLKQLPEDNREFSVDNTMAVRHKKDNAFSFIVGIRQNNITQQLDEPELIKFAVEAVIKDSRFFTQANIRETLDYKFHLGASMQDVWVSFDPGTSGSCVAVGSAADNIMLGEDRANNRIIPSVLVFDKSENYQQKNGTDIPELVYRHGATAQVLYGSNPKRYVGFQSIKKLLGFKDEKEIVFDNKNVLKLKGKDLASLLVKGLYNDVNAYFTRPEFNADDYNRDNKFNPMRAVVAIPNNFTISKIKEMVECIDNLKQFKEIRYVYEAEAVLFYYLSNFSQLDQKKQAADKETVLVYDMGGATINATVVTINKITVYGRMKYEIEILGKIGYGIGGDTIDYCISRFILSCANEFPELKTINVDDKKVQLAKLAFDIKKEIIANFYNNNKYLITAFNLESWINTALSVSIHIDEATSNMYSYFKNISEKYGLFSHPIFTDTVYNNVRDAANEVAELAGMVSVDKIIFSGRSTSFPLVKETVKDIFKAKGDKATSISLKLEESKTAVAKGACWYGVNKNSVVLNNLKTNAAFGFKRTMSADKTNVSFFELVKMGHAFNTWDGDIDFFQGVRSVIDDFAFDSSKVNFYQVMGKDADKILAERQKHKFSRVASIEIDQITEKIGMKVNANDRVDCAVTLQSGRTIIEIGVVSDQEIGDANDEHYTWIIK